MKCTASLFVPCDRYLESIFLDSRRRGTVLGSKCVRLLSPRTAQCVGFDGRRKPPGRTGDGNVAL